ncbi:hypothetical protein L2E82_05716 [Cichorium intybus]|uniref:Uncharacterized protein n=1 Tax=Cichorium intybus TaxID=13427 RepID=A0ACB9H961_CICIN|nr:hypothetical protein L2E82_05716 [Cichorium intybus]
MRLLSFKRYLPSNTFIYHVPCYLFGCSGQDSRNRGININNHENNEHLAKISFSLYLSGFALLMSLHCDQSFYSQRQETKGERNPNFI